MDGNWLIRRARDTPAEFRLFCLPYAGGSAAVYHGWQDLAPDHVEVCAIELPGRGRRLGQTPFSRMTPLVRSLVQAVQAELDTPFAIFGHSMGALIGFELARALRARGLPAPVHLFVSAMAAPGIPRDRPVMCDAPDAELKEELRFLNGTPRELLDNDELMSLMLPTLRADFSILETYEYREEPPLRMPVTVFGGTSDPSVQISSLQGWRHQTTENPRLKMLHGDHFFLHSSAAEIMGLIRDALNRDVLATERR